MRDMLIALFILKMRRFLTEAFPCVYESQTCNRKMERMRIAARVAPEPWSHFSYVLIKSRDLKVKPSFPKYSSPEVLAITSR